MGAPSFSAGAVLTAADMNKVGLWLVKTETIGSAVASVTVTNAFSADYQNYKIIVSGGAGSTTLALSLQIGGATTAYYAAYNGLTFAAIATTASDNNAASFTTVGNGNTTSLMMNLDVLQPYATEWTHIMGTRVTGTAGGAFHIGGMLANTTSYTDFTITTSTGTITGGTIRVYGYRD